VKQLLACLVLGLVPQFPAAAQKPENVLVVVNDSSSLSRSVAEYYARKRQIPERNLCRIRIKSGEVVSRADYDRLIARPVAECLIARKLRESVWFIVTTAGVPLRIDGSSGMGGDTAAVDSELTLLYTDMVRRRRTFNGLVPNPMYRHLDYAVFNHALFPIYLVTRLDGYDFADIRGLVDRSLAAVNRGKFVFDLRDDGDPAGDIWLLAAARRLPRDRVVVDETKQVLSDQKNVIGYASWGSNDRNRHARLLHFEWLPGAIATEFVSTNGRTFARPPDSWTLGAWSDPKTFFADSPQSMTGDYIHEGVTGVSGHVSEPFLQFTPHPEYLFMPYYDGRTLAESYYLAIPALSWQNIVIGDPLCVLKRR
jgi:uncharacterized protein (TIGR03790 family)